MRGMTLRAIAVAALAGLLGCRGGESEERPVHLIKNMDTQEKGKAYRVDTTGLFADGRMMRLPVEGTVAQGQLADDVLLEEGMEGPDMPVKAYPAAIKARLDDEFRARGENRFRIYCSPCHGYGLDGKGVVAGRGMEVPPPSFHDQRLKEMPVGKIYSAIKNGVNNGNMGSYAAQIPVEDRWAIVSYIRQQQMLKDPTVAEEGGVVVVVEKASKSSVKHGEQLYAAKCKSCHTLDGTRLVGPSFKNLFGKKEQTNMGEVVVDAAYVKESVLTPTAKIVNGFPPAMPPQQLNEIEIGSIVMFLESLK